MWFYDVTFTCFQIDMRDCLLALVVGLLFCTATAHAQQAKWTLKVEIDRQPVEGMPLSWSDSHVALLARDGRLWNFDPAEARNHRKLSSHFKAYSDAEIRGQLIRELGRSFEVSSTGHYVVAHPRGQGDNWSGRFEQLYRSFVHYFAVRGFRLEEPQFPLVAIVWKNRADFLRYAQSDGAALGSNVIGYYSPTSNRITLYDAGGGSASSSDWHANLQTVIHEATHQTAFNTGVHSRFADTPTWVVEGLGTLFEATGVFDSRAHRSQSERINQGRLAGFREMQRAGYEPGTLHDLVASDRLFNTRSLDAYAHAWALSFYLVETQPRRYSQYLKLVAAKPPFEKYSSTDRLKDFASVFGNDFRLQEAKFLRFMEGVR